MKGITNRSVQGMLLGWLIAFEGFFALSIAGPATIDGVGGIRASTFTLAAAQLVLLGVFISIIWALKMASPPFDRPKLLKLLNMITYLAMALVAIEGIAIVLMAGNVFVTGFGGVGKKWIALIGAQLFGLGLLSLRLWRLRNVRSPNWLVDLLGSLCAALIAIEGLVAIGIAGNTRIIGVTGFQESTISTGGTILFLLGLLTFIIWTVSYDPWLAPRISKIFTERRSLLLMTVLGGTIMAGSVVATYVAGPVAVDGAGSVIKIVVVAGISQLFALGLVTPLLWKLRSKPLDRHFIPYFLFPATSAVLAFEGVFAMALAANTFIEGTGTILEDTFRLAGAQLLFLAALALLMWVIRDSPLLGDRPRKVVSLASLLALAIIALEGLAVVIMAVNIRIDDFGGVGERYVLLGGSQMVVLSALGLLCWTRSEGMSARFRSMGVAAAAFVLLMLPIALLL